MTDKERLIELIKNAEKAFPETGKPVLDVEEYVADYLLENGVIVLPLNIGDTVYVVGWMGDIEEWAVSIFQCTKSKAKTSICYTGKRSGGDIGFCDNDIGKGVFLTREEAELVLKDGKGDGVNFEI